jgi:peroxiredoxin
MTTVLKGDAAPAISLAAGDGRKHSLAGALKKGPVVAAFFKVTCPICQYTFPFLERLHLAYGNERASFWGISQDNLRDTNDFWKDYGLSFTALLDERAYPVSNAYGLTIVPTVLLIAPDGKVKVSFTGFSKKGLEAVSAELARHFNVPAKPVFLPDEIVPDTKPG